LSLDLVDPFARVENIKSDFSFLEARERVDEQGIKVGDDSINKNFNSDLITILYNLYGTYSYVVNELNNA
jgi:hypothetical protein